MAYVLEKQERDLSLVEHLFPMECTLKSGQKIELVVSREEHYEQMRTLLNQTIEDGGTYPQKAVLSEEQFRAYYLHAESFCVVPKGEGDFAPGTVLGCFYIKPNFPGHCSHICNGGFLTLTSARRQGVGRFMGTCYLPLAKSLGYKSSMFNLVFVTNIASLCLWRSLGFEELGTIPKAGYFPSLGGYIDAIQFYYDLDKRLGPNLTLLRFRSSEVFMLGTDHRTVSDSCMEFNKLVKQVNPTTIFAELCSDRMKIAQLPVSFNTLIPFNARISIDTKQNNLYPILPFVHTILDLLMPSSEKEEIRNDDPTADEYDNGNEMIEAFTYARRQNIPFIAADQPFSHMLTCFLKEWRYFPSFYFEIKKQLNIISKNEANSEHMIAQSRKHLLTNFPALASILITSRDVYMTENIIQYLTVHPSCRGVVVVGKVHLQGIREQWELVTPKTVNARSPANDVQ